MLYAYGSHHQSSTSSDQRQATARANQQLHRYSHEPVSSSLLHREIPPILILLFFLFLIIITLSQILVVHTSRYGANFYSMQKVQEELKQMDESMEAMLRDNVLPIDKWRLLFHIETYLSRFEYLFDSWDNQSEVSPNASRNQRTHQSSHAAIRENTSEYVARVQSRLQTLIDQDERVQWRQGKPSSDQLRKKSHHAKRRYCSEEPRHLRKL